jgi:uncharacterized protein (DUF983 family)
MKKCPKCDMTRLATQYMYGDNYCTVCGEKLVDVFEKEYQCGNTDCRIHKARLVFTEGSKFCGECGYELIAADNQSVSMVVE